MSYQVFFANIQSLSSRFWEGYPLLSAKRRERISRCKHEIARLQLLTAGLLLHRVLSVSTDTQFFYTPHGKPYLPNGPYFNLSHSGNLVALAVSDTPIGLDLQEITATFYSGVATRYFTEEEQLWMQNRPDRFFWLWTRKESVIKALGLGLSASLTTSFCVLEKTTTVGKTTLSLLSQTVDCTMVSIATPSSLSTSFCPTFLSAKQLLTPTI